ncbi:MAG: hypothetical protein ACFFBD_07445 [Candidatus Hodarchaeota archaeon]
MSDTNVDKKASEEFVNKFQQVVDQIIEQPECLAGRALAALYFRLFSKTVGIREPDVNATMSLEYLASDAFRQKIDKLNIIFGVFLHSFVLQSFAISLQLEIMCQNCLKWLEGEQLLINPVQSASDMFEQFPCINPGTPAIQNITLLGDLQSLWQMYAPEKQFFDFYRDLIHKVLLEGDGSARLPLLETQLAFEQAMNSKVRRGEFLNRFARASFAYQLKLRLWLIDFIEKANDRTYFSTFEKYKRRRWLKDEDQKTLQDLISDVLAKTTADRENILGKE